MAVPDVIPKTNRLKPGLFGPAGGEADDDRVEEPSDDSPFACNCNASRYLCPTGVLTRPLGAGMRPLMTMTTTAVDSRWKGVMEQSLELQGCGLAYSGLLCHFSFCMYRGVLRTLAMFFPTSLHNKSERVDGEAVKKGLVEAIRAISKVAEHKQFELMSGIFWSILMP